MLISYDSLLSKLSAQVRDTGVGIAPDDLSKLFKRFGKLKNTACLNREGIGLGLTIVQNIVHEAEGVVSVHSDGIGKGSCFSFSMKMHEGNHI